MSTYTSFIHSGFFCFTIGLNNEFLIIPKVVSYLQVQDVELLLLEWIDMHNGDQKKLGKGLAEMHLKAAQNSPIKFGFPIEGFIGLTNQNKGWENSWIDCFINLRIKPQLSILKNNFLDIKTKNIVFEKPSFKQSQFLKS